MNERLNFVFINGRGSSGKDTQADLLVVDNPRSSRISTGDIYRGAKTPEGIYGRFHEQVKPYIAQVDKGGYIPDEVMLPIVGDVIEEQLEEGKDTFVFTGFPRTLGQLESVDTYIQSLQESGDEVKATFLCYAVLEQHSISRAEKRRKSAAAKGEAVRADDEASVVERRLQAYNENTKPMLKKLVREKRLNIIKSNGTIEEVQERTKKALDKK